MTNYQDYQIVGATPEKKSFVGNHDTPKPTKTLADFISKPTLETKQSAGAVGSPVYASNTLKATGTYKTNDPYLNITASEQHMEAPAYPAIKQDVPEKAKNQYE